MTTPSVSIADNKIETIIMGVNYEDKENQVREGRAEEYEHAVRRALTENAYVKKVNTQLIAKLNTMTHDNDASKGSIHRMMNMKEHMADSAAAADTSDIKASRRADEKIVTIAKLEALESKQRSMDEMVTALSESLDVACRERDDANAKVAALLLAAEEPVALVNDVWERNAAENWERLYNESSNNLVEVMYERDRLKAKCDELQSMKGVETVFISKKNAGGEANCEELTKQLKAVTSERNCLRDEISKKVEELLAEKKDSENLAAEKASLQKEIADLTKTVDGHSVTKSSMQSMIDSLQYKVAAVKLAKDVEVGNLRQELEIASTSLVETSSKRDFLLVEHSALKQRVHALKVELSEANASREYQVQVLQEELATAQASQNNAETNAKKHSVDLEALKIQLKVANESLNAMRVENHKLSEDLQTHRATSTLNLSDFSRRLECIDAKNESLASENDDLKLENSTLQHQLQNIQSYVSQINVCQHWAVQTAENSVEIVSSNHIQQAENEYLSNERNELMAKNDALQQKNETLQKKLSDITAAEDSTSEAFKRLIGELRMQLAEKEKKSNSLTQQLNDFREAASQEQDRLNSKIALLEDDVLQSKQIENCMRSDLETSKKEQDRLQSKIAVLETNLHRSEQEEDRLCSALELLKSELSEARAQSEQEHADFQAKTKSLCLTLDTDLGRATLEQEQMKSKIASLENDLLQSKQEEGRLRDAVALLDSSKAEALACLENDKAELEIQVKSLSLTIDAVKERADREQEQLKSKVETLEEDLRQTMLNNISDAKREQQLRSLEAEKQLLEESILFVRSNRDEIIQQLECARQETEDFRRKLEASDAQAESMITRCEQAESEIQASKQAVVDLNNKLESSESFAKAMEEQCDQLRSTIAELTTKCDEAAELMNLLQIENQHIIASCRQQEERSNNDIESLENMISALKSEYETFKVDAEAAATAQLKSCEAKLESLCAMDDDSNSRSQGRSFDDIIAILAQERTELVENSTSTAKQLETAQKDISALELAVASLKKEYEAFRFEAESAATAQLKCFEAKLEPIQTELSSKVKDLEVAHDEKVVLEQQISNLSTEVSKFKMQNKGLLKAMDQLTKYM